MHRLSIHRIELERICAMARERNFRPSAAPRRLHTAPERSLLSDPSASRLGRRVGPAWLTVSQLCHRWQLGRKTIYKFINAKILPVWKVGTHLYRVAVEDVLRFEARNKIPPR